MQVLMFLASDEMIQHS